jgi:sugar-specific transcriptional regulator TrmB
MFSEQVFDVLIQLGLSPLQAKLYSALIQLQDPTATTASKVSKIARQEVYRITEELEAMGLISKTISTPMRFQPVPLSEGLSILMERRTKTTSGLMKKIRELSRETEKKQEKVLSSYVIKELSPQEDWFGNSPLKLQTATTFDLMTTQERLASRILADTKVFRKAVRTKKTMIRIITDKPTADSPIWEPIRKVSAYPYFQFRYVDQTPDAIMIIFNKKEAALSLSLNNPPGPPYLFANHPVFLYLALEHFDNVWNRAKQVTFETAAV